MNDDRMNQRAHCSLLLSLFASCKTGSLFVSCYRRSPHRKSIHIAGSILCGEMMDEFLRNFTTVSTNVGGIFAYEKRTGDRHIRIEKDIETNVQEAAKSRSKVMERIASARAVQAKRGNATLLEREWEKTLEKTSNRFVVAQFNALAEGLSSGPDALSPFLDESQTMIAEGTKDFYGGFDAIIDPGIVLDFEHRRWRLLEVILGSNAQLEYDLIAMEEVDRFYGFFAPILETFGYTGVFTPKRESPGVRKGWYSDGCCLFWKENLFEAMAVKQLEYKVGTQVYMIVTLKHRATKKLLVVAVTHLKARVGNGCIRSRQAHELLCSLHEEAELVRTRFGEANPALLIAGDFNAAPPTLVGGEVAVSKIVTRDGRIPLSSVYPLDDTSLFTTWKIRGAVESKRMIDYIFFGGSLKCVNRLLLPEEDSIGRSRLPSLRFPSDHVHIASQFELLL